MLAISCFKSFTPMKKAVIKIPLLVFLYIGIMPLEFLGVELLGEKLCIILRLFLMRIAPNQAFDLRAFIIF